VLKINQERVNTSPILKNHILIAMMLILSVLLLSFLNIKEPATLSDGIDLSIFEAPSSISMKARVLSKEEARSKVASEVKHHGYTILVLAIENSSPYQWEFKQENIDLKLADNKKIMKDVRLSSLPRSIGYKIVSLFFWPVMIPGAIDGFVTMQTEHVFKDKLYASTSKKEGEIIIPYSTIQRYLYLSSEQVPKSFDIKIFNCRTLKYQTYNVEIANT